MELPLLPKVIIDYILEYDGRIKYKSGKYIDIIYKYDFRYLVIQPIINKKLIIQEYTEIHDNNSFYFEFNFNNIEFNNFIGLVYDYNSIQEKFEICYFNFSNNFQQIRTII